MLATNMQKWYHTAHSQGELQGFAVALEIQIRAKFPDANDADFMPKLHAADQEDLMRYIVNAAKATDIKDVFS
jgi:hypothetical protein